MIRSNLPELTFGIGTIAAAAIASFFPRIGSNVVLIRFDQLKCLEVGIKSGFEVVARVCREALLALEG